MTFTKKATKDPHDVAGSGEESTEKKIVVPGGDPDYGVYGYYKEETQYYWPGYNDIFHEFSDPESSTNAGRRQNNTPMEYRRVTTREEHDRLLLRMHNAEKRVTAAKAKEMDGNANVYTG